MQYVVCQFSLSKLKFYRLIKIKHHKTILHTSKIQTVSVDFSMSLKIVSWVTGKMVCGPLCRHEDLSSDPGAHMKRWKW